MLAPADYTVGWICAISTEYVAAISFLDEEHDAPDYVFPNDMNIYTLGKVGKHNTVIAVLPDGEYGATAATSVAKDILRSFPNIRISLMVGIGGGAPSSKHDIRLGDIVVSAPRNGQSGVFQYDFGKTIQERVFQNTKFLDQPPTLLRNAMSDLKALYERNGHGFQNAINNVLEKAPKLRKKYQRPHPSTDRLYRSEIVHPSAGDLPCSTICPNGSSVLMVRPPRDEDEDDPMIHYGLIASGNQLMKDALIRDFLAVEKDVICFEMEAAGLMNHFPCLVIRGICDYSDSHKNKDWQGYAAMMAAAYAKDLLGRIPPSKIEAEKRITDTLCGVKEGINQLVRAQNSQDHDTILDWLTPVNYGLQQSDYFSQSQEGSGKWFLDSNQFKSWLSHDNRTLFCPGIPGSGKTILTSIAINNLHLKFPDDPNIGISYIYFNFNRQDEQTVSNLLASLLKQLAASQSSLPKAVQDLYRRHKARQTRPSIEELIRSLQSIISTYSRTFILIDALDECQSSEGRRTQFLSEIFALQDKTGANLFATSRIISEITEIFQGGLSLEIRASEEDIHQYLSRNMFKLPRFVHDNNLQNEITNCIHQAAQGMFLLARLHLDSLEQKTTPKAVLMALRNLASGHGAYQEAYYETVERIKSQFKDRVQLARSALTWITYAKRPLTIIELQQALGVELGEPTFDERNIPDIGLIVSVCAGLVAVDNKSNIVRMVHYTAQEYFQQKHTTFLLEAPSDPESELTNICVTYLSYDTFGSGACASDRAFEDRLQTYPFYHYASCHWGHHANEACDISNEALVLLESAGKVESSCQALVARKPWHGSMGYSARFPRRMTGLHLAVCFGVLELIKNLLLQTGADLEATTSNGITPLLIAVSRKSEAVVQLLLNKGANPEVSDRDGQTPLILAVKQACKATKQEDVAIVQLLLDKGADLEAIDRNSQTPLFWAIRKNEEAIIQLLLDRGANLQIADISGQTPLFWAIYNKNCAIIQLLLDRGVNIEVSDMSGQTPLFWAIGQANEDVVQLLLDNSANIETVDKDGQTPLISAIKQGDGAIIRLLINGGANIEAADMGGRTPLFWAIWKEDESITELLLDGGADLEAVDQDGQTPLFWAITERDEVIIQLLLNKGANLEAIDKYGQTPLFWAVQDGYDDVIQLLLYNGANVEVADGSSQTPRSPTIKRVKEDPTELLLD